MWAPEGYVPYDNICTSKTTHWIAQSFQGRVLPSLNSCCLDVWRCGETCKVESLRLHLTSEAAKTPEKTLITEFFKASRALKYLKNLSILDWVSPEEDSGKFLNALQKASLESVDVFGFSGATWILPVLCGNPTFCPKNVEIFVYDFDENFQSSIKALIKKGDDKLYSLKLGRGVSRGDMPFSLGDFLGFFLSHVPVSLQCLASGFDFKNADLSALNKLSGWCNFKELSINIGSVPAKRVMRVLEKLPSHGLKNYEKPPLGALESLKVFFDEMAFYGTSEEKYLSDLNVFSQAFKVFPRLKFVGIYRRVYGLYGLKDFKKWSLGSFDPSNFMESDFATYRRRGESFVDPNQGWG